MRIYSSALSFTASNLSFTQNLHWISFYKNDVQTQIYCAKSLQTSWQSQNVYVQSLKWHKSSLLVDALAAFINHFLSITVITEQSQSPCIAPLWQLSYCYIAHSYFISLSGLSRWPRKISRTLCSSWKTKYIIVYSDLTLNSIGQKILLLKRERDW